MKKFINGPEHMAAEILQGLELAYSDKVHVVFEKIVMRAKPKAENKVALVTLGGGGHEPALSGFVGEGMLDASVVGDIFAAPGAPKLLEALRLLKRDAGILLIVLNHAGDIMSANMAIQMAEAEGIKLSMVLTSDDISAGLDASIDDKRGLAGCIPLYKIAGAAAEEGKSLEEVTDIAQRFNAHVSTLAVAMTGATHPQNGAVLSTLPDDEMEIGMGQHGEAGGGRFKILTADETALRMVQPLTKAAQLQKGDTALLIVNGTGGSAPMELLLVYRRAALWLKEQGITLVNGLVDELLTVQEMAGFQMIVAKLDPDHVRYLKLPADTPYWTVK